MASSIQMNTALAVNPAHSAKPAETNDSAAAGATPVSRQNDTGALRMIYDPFAGMVLEYLNSSGSVQSQIPSAAVVAYLHWGLTADGLGKPQAATLSIDETA